MIIKCYMIKGPLSILSEFNRGHVEKNIVDSIFSKFCIRK